MELSDIVLVIGYFVFLVGWGWGLRVTFMESTTTGVCCFLVPLYLLYYLLFNLATSWKPLVLISISIVIMLVGLKLSPAGFVIPGRR